MARYNIDDYRVTPSVVCVGVPTEITVTPRGENARFPDGYEFALDIFGADTANTVLNEKGNYISPARTRLTLRAENGCLKFTVTFPSEQQYVLKINLPEELQYSTNPHYNPPYRSAHAPMKRDPLRFPTLSVFAVEPDLFGLRVFKGDLHAHTWDSDGHESNPGLIADWVRAGHAFGAITNHYWHHSYEQANETLKKLPDFFTLLPGEEVHVPSEFIHVVSVGGKHSVNDRYYEHSEEVLGEIAALQKTLDIPEGIDPYNYACRVWIAEQIRKEEGLSVLTHPFWIWNEVYFMPLPLTRLLHERKIYDCLEFNCGSSEDANLTAALYYEERARGFEVPFVGSSDTHEADAGDEFHPSTGSTLVLAKDRSWESIRDAILSGRSAVMEQWTGESSYRLYGSFRMVKYLNFLVNAYYPAYIRVSYPLGELLKDYEADSRPETAELIRMHKERCDAFNDAFFGTKTN